MRKPTTGLARQIRSAQGSIRRNKQTIPQIYPEYQELQLAQLNLHQAKERLAIAQRAWKALGT